MRINLSTPVIRQTEVRYLNKGDIVIRFIETEVEEERRFLLFWTRKRKITTVDKEEWYVEYASSIYEGSSRRITVFNLSTHETEHWNLDQHRKVSYFIYESMRPVKS